MRPITKSALTFLSVGCLLALFFTGRWMIAAGAFTRVTPVSPGACRVLASLAGPADFAVDAPHDAIFVASSDRRRPGPRDGIYLLKLDDPGAPPQHLAAPSKDFHPTGISLYRAPDGSETLMAINHQSAGSWAVEIFTITYPGGVPALNAGSSIAGGLLVSPHDIFAVGTGHFYLTNDHATKTALGRFAEDDLLWPHADLLYFDGMSFHIAVQRLASPDGVLMTPDGRHLYVSTAADRRVIAFSREQFTGDLSEIGALSLPARPDKISLDAEGNLIVAAHPNLLKLQAFQADPAQPSPSDVLRVRLDGQGVPQSFETIYANDGKEIGAASSAVIRNGHLLIGSVLDDKMLDCDIK